VDAGLVARGCGVALLDTGSAVAMEYAARRYNVSGATLSAADWQAFLLISDLEQGGALAHLDFYFRYELS
jgi:hypothetical protein